MADIWGKIDVVAKIAIGVGTLALSAVLIEQHSDDRVELRRDGLRREFQVYYGLARNAVPADPVARSDLDLASTVAQTLAGQPYGDGFYTDAVVTLRARRTPQKPLADSVVTPVTLQASEAASAPVSVQVDSEWFAVLGSYAGSTAGLEQARARARASRSVLCTEIWQTRVSKVYALVAQGATTRATALVLAQRARTSGVAGDAFTQANRAWVKIEGCPAA